MTSDLEFRHNKALTAKEAENLRAKEAPEPLSPPEKTQRRITQAKINA
jgi:hypothetical protein